MLYIWNATKTCCQKVFGTACIYIVSTANVYSVSPCLEKVCNLWISFPGNCAIWKKIYAFKNKEIHKKWWKISSKLKGNLPLLEGNFGRICGKFCSFCSPLCHTFFQLQHNHYWVFQVFARLNMWTVMMHFFTF